MRRVDQKRRGSRSRRLTNYLFQRSKSSRDSLKIFVRLRKRRVGLIDLSLAARAFGEYPACSLEGDLSQVTLTLCDFHLALSVRK